MPVSEVEALSSFVVLALPEHELFQLGLVQLPVVQCVLFPVLPVPDFFTVLEGSALLPLDKLLDLNFILLPFVISPVAS